MYKLMMFDMDGVIADTEPLHYAMKYEMLRAMGVADRPDFSGLSGKSMHEIWTPLIEQYHLPKTYEEIARWQCELVLRGLIDRGIGPSHGLLPLLDALDAAHVPYALVSSSGRTLVDGILALYGLDKRFCDTIAGTDGFAMKPAPDLYLEMLRRHGVSASEAATVEDSSTGIQAAKAAGLTCIAYRNPTSGVQDLRAADTVVDSLFDAIGWIGL